MISNLPKVTGIHVSTDGARWTEITGAVASCHIEPEAEPDYAVPVGSFEVQLSVDLSPSVHRYLARLNRLWDHIAEYQGRLRVNELINKRWERTEARRARYCTG